MFVRRAFQKQSGHHLKHHCLVLLSIVTRNILVTMTMMQIEWVYNKVKWWLCIINMQMNETIVLVNEELYSFHNFEWNVSHYSAYLLELSTQFACAHNFSAMLKLYNEITRSFISLISVVLCRLKSKPKLFGLLNGWSVFHMFSSEYLTSDGKKICLKTTYCSM